MGFYGNLWKKTEFALELSENVHYKDTKYSE